MSPLGARPAPTAHVGRHRLIRLLTATVRAVGRTARLRPAGSIDVSRLLAVLPVVPVVVALLLSGCAPVPAAPPTATASVAGEWEGRIEIPGSPLDVGITLTPEDGGLRGEIDIPAQGVVGMPLADVLLDGSDLTFRLPEVPGDARFRGTVEGNGASIPGTFTQNGRSFPLVLMPGAGPGRPQEPQPPFPYRAEEVTYPGEGIDIAGTLTLPEGPGPFTAVLLVTGSGAQDRNEELFGHKPFLLLADTLTRAGHAVLRVDDRGVGGTGGSLDGSTYDELSADVVAGVEYLRGRPEIDPERIGLLGHSEGGYLVPLAAQRTDVAFAVLMAGPAAPGEEVLVAQTRLLMEAAGAPADAVEQQLGFIHELVQQLRAEDYEAARALAKRQIEARSAGLPAEQRPTPEQVEAQVAATVTPYYRSFVVHDPARSLRALDIPVLAFFGGRDLQVPAEQSEPAMSRLLSGNPDATIRTFPELNHLMQPARTGGLDEYGAIETTIDPQVLDLVRSWLTERFPVGR